MKAGLDRQDRLRDRRAMTRILVIEDEARTASEIVGALNEAGLFTRHSADGAEGLQLALEGGFDAITLDRLLPGLDGLDVLRELRGRGLSTPVLMVSALGEIDDRVRGLRAGGDDYLIKPFALVELVARVEALVRRPRGEPLETVLTAGPLRMDLLNRRVSRGGRSIDVTQREFRLLEYFLRNAGQLLTRSMLYEAVWDYKFDPGTNLIDVHIGRLRRKVDAEGETPTIVTVRGSGWKFDAAE
jgi:two-component system OmpR family response regulator